MTTVETDPFATLARAVADLERRFEDRISTVLARTVSVANDSADVPADEGTTSTGWTDLVTTGPTVTLTTGTKALIVVTGNLRNSGAGGYSFMGYAISGASTVAAGGGRILEHQSPSAGGEHQGSAVYLLEGLTPGANTFTAKYSAGSGTANFKNRHIAVIDMGS